MQYMTKCSIQHKVPKVLVLLAILSSLISPLALSQQVADNPTKKQEKVYSIPNDAKQKLLNEMILVKGGSFVMGSNAETARKMEKPEHPVSLNDFYIGSTEVTVLLWQQVMGWDNSYFACETCAVNNISWSNMQLFISRLNQATGLTFRLPTEAEWEFAARGGIKSKGYTYSGSNKGEDVAWYDKNAQHKSHPVELKKPNELGLYDMTGNLWEFCYDDISRTAYSSLPKHNPIYIRDEDITQKSMRVVRGGGYDSEQDEMQVFRRDGSTSNVRMPDIGFRLAISQIQ